MKIANALVQALLSGAAIASPTGRFDTAVKRAAKYPFNRIVAFGDNLSDNGNGSVAHGVAQLSPPDPKNKIYGYGTWTNGPVAISYLAGYLGMPLLDYAFGHADGGSKFGATVDNAYTQSTANAPSSKDQIANYTSSANVKSASSALHFLWIGANDINLYHINTSPGADNSKFASEISTRIAAQVQTLINAGAPVVLVGNLYPKDLSPSRIFYAQPSGYATLGNAIKQANTAIQNALKPFGNKAIYFDANAVMTVLFNDRNFGFTRLTPEFCDGYSAADFQDCLVPGKNAAAWYWTQYLDPTTRVHNWLGFQMLVTLQQRYGG